MFIEDAPGGGYVMTSYWLLVTHHAGEAARVMMLGWYRDTCVKEDGQWRFSEKQIHRWDSETVPPAPAA
jgi:hypothetical protein